MEDEPRLALKVIGQLRLCPAFETFGDRVERLTELSYADYLVALSQTDIAIAPLEPTLFNDCKSNIKYLEASVAGVASICSPRAAFLTILRHNQNGLAADGPAAWREGFLRLARDGALRERLARSARADVLARYAPEVIAQTQGKRFSVVLSARKGSAKVAHGECLFCTAVFRRSDNRSRRAWAPACGQGSACQRYDDTRWR